MVFVVVGCSQVFNMWEDFNHIEEVHVLAEMVLEALVSRGLVLESIEISRDRNSGVGGVSFEDVDPITGFLKVTLYRVWGTRVKARLSQQERLYGAHELAALFTAQAERAFETARKHTEDALSALERRRGGRRRRHDQTAETAAT